MLKNFAVYAVTVIALVASIASTTNYEETSPVDQCFDFCAAECDNLIRNCGADPDVDACVATCDETITCDDTVAVSASYDACLERLAGDECINPVDSAEECAGALISE